MTVPKASNPALEDFIRMGNDGRKWDSQDNDTWDSARFYNWMVECRKLLVSKNEVSWLERHTVPDRSVDVFVNMSCGTQLVPHVTLEIVDVLTRLGVSFMAGTGPQFCCGKPFMTHDMMDAGNKVTQTSVARFMDWGATIATHACQSCQIVHSTRAAHDPDAAGLTNIHLTGFLENRLRELGDTVPWKHELPVKVLVEGHDITPVHIESMHTVARVMGLIPGVEVVGRVEPPGRGAPCATDAPGAPSVLAELTDSERHEVVAELEEQAARTGASVIVPSAHYCLREWSKFSSERVAVKHYMTMLAEALGCSRPDRYQQFWKLRNPAQVFELSRPYWESWGMSPQKARDAVNKTFEPHYTGFFNPKCACGGDPARCNTGKFSLA
jgi:hypothetical protein